MSSAAPRPVALITGVGRRIGIGAAIAVRLARDGWDVGLSGWAPYDDRMPWGRDLEVTGSFAGDSAGDSAGEVAGEVADRGDGSIARAIRAEGARTVTVAADLEDVAAAGQIFDGTETALGPVTALVRCHCESVDSSLLDTTV